MTSLFNNTFDVSVVSVPEKAEVPPASKKHSMLPLLTVLFIISYGLMTMLIVEQGQTIESQRVLIRELFRDSSELTSMKQAQITKKNSEMRAQAPANQVQSNQVQPNQVQPNPAPSTQTPSTQVQANQAPYSQALPQHQSQRQNQKPQFQMPSRPASDLMDENRSVITI